MTTFARIVTGQLTPATVADGIRVLNEQVAPQLCQQPGFTSWELLVNHTTGKMASVSHFATEADAQADESQELKDRTAMLAGYLDEPIQLAIYAVDARS